MSYIYSVPGIARLKNTRVHIDVQPETVSESLQAGDAVVFLDPDLLANAYVRSLLTVCDPSTVVVLLRSTEKTKSIETLKSFDRSLLDARSTGWVIGSGSLINFAYYAFALRREADPAFRVVSLPSNTMSVCDVAVGSLGLLNDASSGRKNAFRRTCDPDDVFLCRWLLSTGDLAMQQEGVIEALKHALFQEPSSIPRLAQAFFADAPSFDELFECAVAGLHMKCEVMRLLHLNPHHVGKGILSYGHFHATALEEALDFRLPHAWAVLFGLLVDLHLDELAGPRDLLVAHVAKWAFRQEFAFFWQQATLDPFTACVQARCVDPLPMVLSPRRTLCEQRTTISELGPGDRRQLQPEAVRHAARELGLLLAAAGVR